MTIAMQCPVCSEGYQLRDELAGKRVRCKACGEQISVPFLRSLADRETERSRPASTASPRVTSSKSEKDSGNEPTPVKSTLARSTASPLPSAQQKPTTKPKRAPQRHNDDDLVLDDDDDIDDEDDFDEPDEYESARHPRSPVKKRSKKKSGLGFASIANGLGSLIEGMKFKISLFSLFIFFCLGVCLTTLLFPAAIIPLLPLLLFGGMALMIFSSFWSIVVTFRVSVGWGIFFFVSGMANGYFTAVGQPGIGAVIYIVSFLLNIMLLVEHWDEYRGPVLCSVAGTVLIMTGPFAAICGIAGAGGAIPLGRPMPVPVFNNGRLPLPRNDGPFPLINNAKQDAVPLVPAEVGLFPVADVPIPGLPEFSLGPGNLGERLPIAGISCVRLFFTTATSEPRLPVTVPGVNTMMIYFEPIGPHRPQSLPCLLIANAGSNLLEGKECLTKESVSEIVPYVKAGFAVIGFSLDGYSAKKPQYSDELCLKLNFMSFQKAHAGLVNVRNVVEFASQKIPQVNPNQLFIVGHSSAATLALLAAAHEPRLKGAVAFAPVSDVEARLRETLNAPASQHVMPGIHHFARQSSPLSHAKRVACPVFLFHAVDDGNVPVSDSRKFAELLKANGKQVEHIEVPTGNHYDSMIQQGIPRAIPWLKQLASANGSNAAPAMAQNQTVPKQNAGMQPVPMLPLAPLTNLPQNTNAGGQPSGRVVTFRFQSFGGPGDAAAAARQALRNVGWADLNDIEVDAAKGEIRIGQLGGSVNTGTAHQALGAAGFQMLPGVVMGSKSALAAAAKSPLQSEKADPPKPTAVTSNEIPDIPLNNPPAKPGVPKTKPTPVASANDSPEKRPEREKARRVVTFKYERFTGKGSSANAMKEALKRVDWADQNDLAIDATKKEIRIGLQAESPNFEQARKALTNQGFVLSAGMTTATTKD